MFQTKALKLGLQLEISLDKDIRELDLFFSDLKFKAVTRAAKKALNKAVVSTQSIAIKEIQKRRKLQLQQLKGSKKKDIDSLVFHKKAFGMTLSKLEARVFFSGRPLPMILFIIGKPTPRVQTKKNANRQSRQFQIQTGQTKSKPGLFVQKSKHDDGRYQVFRRRDPSDRSKGTRMQSVPSLAQLLKKDQGIFSVIKSKGLARLVKEYDRALKLELSKLKL